MSNNHMDMHVLSLAGHASLWFLKRGITEFRNPGMYQ